MKKIGFFIALAAMVALASCDKEEDTMYEDGTYRAEMEEYHYGWKDFMVIKISGDDLSEVTFDAFNEEDNTKMKSGTTAEEYPMDPHPSVWIPELESQYMAVDITNYEPVDGITGATGATSNAQGLFELILDAAKEGNTDTQILEAH